jgi:hypothetical protein
MNSSEDGLVVKSERLPADQKEASRTRVPRPGVRLAAIRRAREVKTARDARLRVRELDVEAALGQYYEGVAAAEEIIERADTRAREILSEAESAASAPRRASKAAVRRLKDLGENQVSLVELTGLSSAQVRECLAGAEDPARLEETKGPDRGPRVRTVAQPVRGGERR